MAGRDALRRRQHHHSPRRRKTQKEHAAASPEQRQRHSHKNRTTHRISKWQTLRRRPGNHGRFHETFTPDRTQRTRHTRNKQKISRPRQRILPNAQDTRLDNQPRQHRHVPGNPILPPESESRPADLSPERVSSGPLYCVSVCGWKWGWRVVESAVEV